MALLNTTNIIDRLYREVIEQFGPNSELRRVYVYGGRGIGKSSVLRAIAASFGGAASDNPQDQRVHLIDGRDWEVARHEIEKHAISLEGGRRGLTLLLDDIDQLCMLVAIFAGEQEFEATLRSIMRVTAALVNQGGRLVLSATYPQARLLEVLHQRELTSGAFMRFKAFSSVLLRFDPLQLDPWRPGWRERIGELLQTQISNSMSGEAIQAFLEVILDLTGGHPALLTWALLEVQEIATAKRPSTVAQRLAEMTEEEVVSSPDVGQLLRRDLEDHLRRGLIPLRRAISSLRDSDDFLSREAYAALRRLVHDTSFTPASLKVREILLDEGLIYADPETGRYVIPGSVLQRELLHEDTPVSFTADIQALGQQSTPPAGLEIEPDPHFPEKRGDLVVTRGGKATRIRLSGGPWTILKLLSEDHSKVLSLQDLKRPPLNTLPAVRSAIQRFEARLKKEGVDSILENVYGRGYRLVGD